MEFLVQQEHLSKAVEKAAQTDGHDDAAIVLGYQVRSRLGDDHTSNCADVVAVQVDYEYRAERLHRSFIFKVPFNHPHYEAIRKLGMYQTETIMYETVLPKLNALLQQPISPECYLLADHDTLVLENLTVRGYRNGPTKLDFDHCIVLLKTLAKFQAASYKVGQQDPTLLTAVPQKQLYQNGVVVVRSDKMFSLYERLMREEGVGASSVEKLRALKGELMASSAVDAATDVFDFQVLNHASLKSANVMFLYDQQGQHPVSARFVDFQTCRWGSPANDVINVWGLATNFLDFEEKFAHFEEIYLKSLNQWLMFFVCGSKYEQDQFEAGIEKLALYKIFMFFCHGGQELQRILNVGNLTNIDWNDDLVAKVAADGGFMRTFLGWIRYLQNIGLL